MYYKITTALFYYKKPAVKEQNTELQFKHFISHSIYKNNKKKRNNIPRRSPLFEVTRFGWKQLPSKHVSTISSVQRNFLNLNREEEVNLDSLMCYLLRSSCNGHVKMSSENLKSDIFSRSSINPVLREAKMQM